MAMNVTQRANVNMKHLFLIFLITNLMNLLSCGKSDSPEVVAPPNDSDKQDDGTGPFVVTFKAEDQTYTHTLKININQDQGKVEYQITTPEATAIEFTSAELNVVGCPASQVTHKTFWLPDATKTVGSFISPGKTFRTDPTVLGIFRHEILNIGGCSGLTLTTNLKKTKFESRPCVGETNKTSKTCSTLVYCRESDINENYFEVEIWKDEGSLALSKFMNRGDGTRALMMKTSVREVNDTKSRIYEGISSQKAKLSFDRITGVGGLNYNLPSGHPMSITLTCKHY